MVLDSARCLLTHKLHIFCGFWMFLAFRPFPSVMLFHHRAPGGALPGAPGEISLSEFQDFVGRMGGVARIKILKFRGVMAVPPEVPPEF